MISFNYENDFILSDEALIQKWISTVISDESFKEGEINYIFCNDDFLHQLNVEFLKHDTLTDVIGFDYSVGKLLQGDIFISTQRVVDNAKDFQTSFENELYRVMVHGILHFCGYKDKSEEDARLMRQKEDTYLLRLHHIS